ncbi:MAG TPA: TetR/AcrR family transcriptional regulator [Solirubrobacteraceae bacterium]|nr:TetR/AcrR family transcriptional regulator [Solirubrobacteraceae bacterium]
MADDRVPRTRNGRDGRHAPRSSRRAGATPRTIRKSSQRERLLSAVTAVAARDGYAAATIAQVIAAAGVSRRTFYEHFTDKEECFLLALKDTQEQLLAEIRRAVIGHPENALQLAIVTLVAFVGSQPVKARVLLNEALAGGPAALDARDHAIDQITQLIEAPYETLDPETPLADVSVRVLLGGICRLLASRLRQSDRSTTSLGDDLLGWTGSYEQPLAAHRWRSLRPVPLPSATWPFPQATLHSPVAPRPVDPGASKKENLANSRSRALAAMACLAEQRGYTATTIGDIANRAGLSTRAFYRLFADKQEAFVALHEDHFRSLMGVTAGAFFAQDTWPLRIWEAGRAFTRYLEQNPILARASFIESYAGDRVTVQRVEELVGAFTLFLLDGYQHAQPGVPPWPVALEAIAMTIFELNYRYIRVGRVCELSALIPHAAFISIAPFLGPGDTNASIDEQLSTARARPSGHI